MGRPRLWTPDTALAALRARIELLGYVPCTRELHGDKQCPSHHYFRLHFGGYKRAIQRLGFEPCTTDRHVRLAPIDPVKAERITRDKQAFWANGCKQPSTWIHPYRKTLERRSA